jgi:hypothetical protein
MQRLPVSTHPGAACASERHRPAFGTRSRNSRFENPSWWERTAHGAKRELIEPTPGDKRFIRRDDTGRISATVDVGKSLSRDVRKRATAAAKPGQGDKGDRAKKG